jgi:DNA polymerase-4
LYLDLNAFFASCEQQENAALRGRPIAVVPMLADTAACLAASYEAKAFGIKTGMRVWEAKKLCPGLRLVTTSHDLYIRYHHRVREAVESCVPIHAICSIDEIACELTGSQLDVDRAKDLALRIKDRIATQVGECMTSSIGIGPNIILSKMAADMQKPNGLTVVRSSELPERLYPQKVEDVPGIGPRMRRRLNNEGFFTLEDLFRTSEDDMGRIWGSLVGKRYYRLLRGENINLRSRATKSLSHEHVLPPKLRHRAGVEQVARKLLAKLAVRLRRNGYRTRHIAISVSNFDRDQKWKAQRKIHESENTSDMLGILGELIRGWHGRGKPLKVAVVFSDLINETDHQFSFFEDQKKAGLFKTVDAINQKFGQNTLYLACFQDDRRVARTAIAFSRIPELDEIETEDPDLDSP